MNKPKIALMSLPAYLLILTALTFIISWKDISLQELLSINKTEEQQKLEEEKRIKAELSSLKIAPLRIIQKMNTAMFETGGVKCKMDIWLQHPAYHTNIHLDQEFENMDRVHIAGRTSLSMLVPGTKFSTSEWIQSYSFGGRSYVFNSVKDRWEKEKLKLSKEKELEQVEYGLFQSLAAPKSDLVPQDSISLVSLQSYKGRDCFVLKFNLDQSVFKQWGLIGKIDNYKAWIDREKFYPYLFRMEGSIGDANFLQIVEYSDFNSPIKLRLPKEISEQAEKENKLLIQKTSDFIEKIKSLRGGSPPKDLKIDFIERKNVRKYIKRKLEQECDATQYRAMETVLKWLNLMPIHYDYREMLLNSATSSIAGFYEPEEKAFYIADWIPEYLSEPVLSHELMHAFQDDKISLEKFLKKEKTLDRLYARKFLIEGEATAVMLQFVYNKQDKSLEEDNDLLSVIREKLSASNESSSSNKYLNLTYSGYAYGARFIQRAIASYGWKNLDKLYEEPPQSMKEIMHPERYFEKKEGNEETKWRIPSLDGWQKYHQDNLGEFIIKMWLEKYVDGEKSETLAEGLKKDEIALYDGQNKKEPLIIFFTEWDSPEDAKNIREAFLKFQDKKLQNKDKKTEEKNYIIWHFDAGDCFLAIEQNLILIANATAFGKEEIDALLKALNSPQPN